MFDMGFLPDISVSSAAARETPDAHVLRNHGPEHPQAYRRGASIPSRVKIGHTNPADTVSHALFPVSST
jgi:hypothetical protein